LVSEQIISSAYTTYKKILVHYTQKITSISWSHRSKKKSLGSLFTSLGRRSKGKLFFLGEKLICPVRSPWAQINKTGDGLIWACCTKNSKKAAFLPTSTSDYFSPLNFEYTLTRSLCAPLIESFIFVYFFAIFQK
jgi:hypothetical protein